MFELIVCYIIGGICTTLVMIMMYKMVGSPKIIRCKHDWSVWTEWLINRRTDNGISWFGSFQRTRRCFQCNKIEKEIVGEHPCDMNKCSHVSFYRPLFSKEETLKELDRQRAKTIKELEQSLNIK